MTVEKPELPAAVRADLARAVRLEWWHIGWTLSIVVVIWLAMGSSQTMKTAWAEDLLGLVPPIAFLIAVRLEQKRPSRLYPYGYRRVHSLGFLVAAVALAAVGGFLLWDAGSTLIAKEHATVGSVRLFGQDIWLGWLMIAAQAYAIIPPFIIGRMELPLAERLQDKILHTDALMNKANWMTGAAGIAGIVGLGLGYWWADSVAAAIISTDIILDGIRALRIASAELVDGTPRALGSSGIDPEAQKLTEALEQRYPGSRVRLRETGRHIHAEIHGVAPDEEVASEELWPGDPARVWRLDQVAFVPDGAIPRHKD